MAANAMPEMILRNLVFICVSSLVWNFYENKICLLLSQFQKFSFICGCLAGYKSSGVQNRARLVHPRRLTPAHGVSSLARRPGVRGGLCILAVAARPTNTARIYSGPT